MPLTLEALEVLDAIDRRGSFAGAARALDRVPSAITYTIRRLEDDLDALLFDRGGRRARFTAAGRELLMHGRRLLAEASALESRIHRISTGWEARLAIAVDTIVPLSRLWPLCARFDAHCREVEAAHTRLKFTREVLGGAWDALADGRVDLVIGASGEPPPGGGWRLRPLADVPLVFAVAAQHPLAHAGTPLTEREIARHRIVVATDTSRALAPRSAGALTGQETLAVPDMPSKVAAQIAGLGCGWVPYFLAADDLASGRLVARDVETGARVVRLHAAWREVRPGNALAWWIDAIGQADWRFLAAGPLDRRTPAPRARAPRRATKR
jgi:DNA-binding transcriptional LysR family regulator